MVRAVHKLFKISHNKAIQELPKHYLDYLERVRAPKERVHDDPPETKYLDYNQDYQTGYVYREPDQPIPVTMPPNSEKGLWGGLGMVEGFHKPKELKPRITRIWYPRLEKHTFYSEILDTHINIEVTERTLQLIDDNKGFDFYILRTREQDLVSEFGRRLKYKMQLALSEDTRDYIKQKYKDLIKPRDEVIWLGLKEHEALTKAKLLQLDESIAPPLRLTYGRELLKKLREEKEAK